MQFSFDIASLVDVPPDVSSPGPFVCRIDEMSFQGRDRCRPLCEVFEAMGRASALAQGLRKPVTSGTPYLGGQRIYLLLEGNVALGFLKVGTKRLFVAPPPWAMADRYGVQDALQEINPACALDFYVHESCQRGGFGRLIFDEMLQMEGLQPAELAYDRPSSKLICFLGKHFGLVKYRPQNNNFVVFDEYFQGLAETQRRSPGPGRGRSGQTSDWGIPPACSAATYADRGSGGPGFSPGSGPGYQIPATGGFHDNQARTPSRGSPSYSHRQGNTRSQQSPWERATSTMGPPTDAPAAGMPSGGGGMRATSLASAVRGSARTGAAAGVAAGGSSVHRYASPHSNAGQRMTFHP